MCFVERRLLRKTLGDRGKQAMVGARPKLGLTLSTSNSKSYHTMATLPDKRVLFAYTDSSQSLRTTSETVQGQGQISRKEAQLQGRSHRTCSSSSSESSEWLERGTRKDSAVSTAQFREVLCAPGSGHLSLWI